MSRQIKFRAWIKRRDNDHYHSGRQEMIYFSGFKIEDGDGFVGDDAFRLSAETDFKDGYLHDDFNKEAESFDLMQYTGFNDKNGKEIYEDDILIIKWNVGHEHGLVYWDEIEGMWNIKYKDINIRDSLCVTARESTIYSNKYETPEWLSETYE